ncbi:tyrosine-protein phosphatase [Leucobacter massiliensis]|uniref:Tyrosine specific protein phosphatases domain-containing protein n=1 Tax=Leucobacter massiliensis TaxID=1686285 RepID=A0A2S9QS45_9MICO|nr:tyrosine-protein phosphatase [Leucobacter massiliensis]PRI12398.1 hypothetical protein B4915_01635 [Leucobacter massiliensis]
MDITGSIPVTYNARALGGLAAGGGTVAPVLFRADALTALTPEGQRGLTELGIGHVVDLRTEAERRRAADVLPAAGGPAFTPLPILGGAMDGLVQSLLPTNDEAPRALTPALIDQVMSRLPTLEELYRSMLEASGRQFAELARIVVAAATEESPGVLVHCTAGKDRTGLASALLLSLAGVSREDILADYAVTDEKLAGPFGAELTALVTSLGVPLTPRLETLATRAPEAAMASALDWVEAQYSGAPGYLRAGGLTQDETEKLRAALLAA